MAPFVLVNRGAQPKGFDATMPAARKKIRYAIVGLGHIAQVAVLPAFAHAKRNSTLAAVVSDDSTKRREIAKKYGLDHAYSYAEYERCLQEVDAVIPPFGDGKKLNISQTTRRPGIRQAGSGEGGQRLRPIEIIRVEWR